MNLDALRQNDLKKIFLDCNSEMTFWKKENTTAKGEILKSEKKTISVFLSDIGYQISAENLPVSGRSIVASFRLADFLTEEGDYDLPDDDWLVEWKDKSDKVWHGEIVSKTEIDRSAEIGRAFVRWKK